jgi:eukaryotic-like serine/threonine-protein kinase
VTEGRRTIGRYQLIQRIGRGSMGTVYHAVDADSGRPVALKVMANELSSDAELIERFRREAMAAADLAHPNITQVLDFGEEGEQMYMAMELLQGADLKVVMEREPLGDLGWKLRVMVQVAAGMAFVHARHLVHRDLKPGNIHIMSRGLPAAPRTDAGPCVKIMDFGLVRLGDSNMTRTGMVLGSPAYMAPEQLRGDKADARSDVFALGAVFYEMLAGQRAFAGKGITQIMMAVLSNQHIPLAQTAPDVPRPLLEIVERALRTAAGERYQTAGELHAALEVAHSVYSA